MSIQLLNTVALPNALLAHGRNHVAIYQDGVVSIYAKDDVNNTLVLQPTTYTIAGVTELRMSEDGSVVGAQTATQTIRLSGGVQTPFDIIGNYAVANDGTLVVIAVGAGQISVIRDTTRNFTATVTVNDRVAVSSNSFIVYNASRYLSGSFIGVSLTNSVFASPATYVIHVKDGKFAFFFTNGGVQYAGLTRSGLSRLYFHRNAGNYVIANDGFFDYAIQRAYPQSTPVKLRANIREIPAQTDMSPYTWMQQRFATNTAIEEVAEFLPVLGPNSSVSGNKLVNTNLTVNVQDKLTPVYFKANEDFSIEGWANFSAIDSSFGAPILNMDMPANGEGNKTFALAVLGDLSIMFVYTGTGSSILHNPATPKVTLNSDNHFAVCRVGGTLKIYLNGAEIYSVANAVAAFKTTEFLGIRRGGVGTRWGLRICREQSAYNGAFDPTPLPALTPQYYTNELRDDIVFQTAFRNNALHNEMDFVGGRDITMAGTTSVANGRLQTAQTTTARFSAPCKYFGAGDYTIEVLFRLVSAPGNDNNALLCQYQNPGAGNGWLIYFNSAGNWTFYHPTISSGGVGPGPSVGSTKAFPIGVDVHLVIERVGTTITLYMDGEVVGTLTGTEGLFNASDTYPLRTWWGDSSMVSTVSYKFIRIAKRALYNGSIRPIPIPPKVKAVPTNLIKNGVAAKGITATGGSVSAGSWRMPFNSYLTMPNAPLLCPGTKDFVIEIDCSVQTATVVSSTAFTPFVFWGTWAAPGQPVNFEFVYNHTAQQFAFSASNSGGAPTVTFPFALAFNTQYLIKLIRTAGVLQLWVDGTKIGETPYTEDLLNDTVSPFYIGRRIGGTSPGTVFWYGDWTCKNFSIGAIDQS